MDKDGGHKAGGVGDAPKQGGCVMFAEIPVSCDGWRSGWHHLSWGGMHIARNRMLGVDLN